uniref:Gb protein n=1 Tax=Arundo donax TaxID=35708 RepID=A0A0A8Y851_ARUDO
MGTREVYEEKLRSGAHLHRDPTINPGLGSPCCPRCLSLLNPTAGEGDWAITSVLHDATAVAGSGAGAMLSAVHGFNTGIPFVQKHVKGPKWLQLLVGVPPLLLFSGASVVFGAYALPRFAQLTVTSYYAASSGSHYAVSQISRQIESAHLSESNEKSR